jgi:PKD repeat protein
MNTRRVALVLLRFVLACFVGLPAAGNTQVASEIAMVTTVCPGSNCVTALVFPGGTTGNADDRAPAWSPDGARIAFERNGEILVLDVAGGNPSHIAAGATPAWSPDGSRIAFVSGERTELYLMNLDGSGFSRLTNAAGYTSDPTWSPDGGRIAFTCEVESGNLDICAINTDGTGLARLTTDPAVDSGPAWSPDGLKVAFSRDLQLTSMNPDGSGVGFIGPPGLTGFNPSWSLDGTRLVFVHEEDYPIFVSYVYVINVDGTGVDEVAIGLDPAWRPTVSPPGNVAPTASFTIACKSLICGFNGATSSDPDGTIAGYLWRFGDGTDGSGTAHVSHTYAVAGTYIVNLTVTDNGGASGSKGAVVTLTSKAPPSFLHVGDLDGAATMNPKNMWTASVTVTIEDSSHNRVANAMLSGAWSNGGTSSCTTNASGQCNASTMSIRKAASVTFTVVNVTHVALSYRSTDNHEADGDSNGVSIRVIKP